MTRRPPDGGHDLKRLVVFPVVDFDEVNGGGGGSDVLRGLRELSPLCVNRRVEEPGDGTQHQR